MNRLQPTISARIFNALFLALPSLAAGCGGSGLGTHAAYVPAIRDHSVPLANVSIKIRIPDAAPAKADPRWGYVAPSTRSMLVFLTSEAHPFAADLSARSKGCARATGYVVCTFNDLPVPAYTSIGFTFKTFDAPLRANGKPAGNLLSIGGGRVLSIKTGGNRDIYAQLEPVLGSITATMPTAAPAAGKQTLIPVDIVELDPDRSAIPPHLRLLSPKMGYTQINATLTEANVTSIGGFSLVLDGTAYPAPTLQLDESGQKLGLLYTGSGGHTVVLRVGFGNENYSFTISPHIGVGKRIAMPAIGTAGSLALQYHTLWFTQGNTPSLGSEDLDSNTLSSVPIPSGNVPLRVNAQLAPGGMVAFTESNGGVAVLMNGSITEYTLPTPNAGIAGVSFDPFNDVWFTESTAGKIGALEGIFGGMGSIVEYPAPAGSTPTMIVFNHFIDPGLNRIGSIAVPGNAITETPLPHASSDPCDISGGITGYWIAECSAPRVAQLETTTAKLVEYPTRAPLQHIAEGADQWNYAIDTNGDVEMIDPKGKITLISRPARGMTPLAITQGIDGDVWLLASNATAGALIQILY